MQGIIKQKSEHPALPDLRNLGTVLRIVVIVNGAALVIAFAREPRLWAVAGEWTAITAYLEPQLILDLTLLWLIQPLLARMPSDYAVALVAVIVGGVTVAVNALFEEALGLATGGIIRELAFALGTLALLIAYFRLRARALSPALVEARLQALQARIRPHFLFNSINAVLSLVRSEPQRAEAALEDMADLFRVLMRDNRELTPLADEVELCRQYLDLEKLRLGERLVVDWNVKSMPPDALVPPLVLQPLLENAVYHGIEPSSQPGVLSINIFLSRDDVHAILRNPHAPNSRSNRNGNKMAIANVRERLALHFDAEASLESRISRDCYEVHIRMPYRTTKAVPADAPPAPAQRTPPFENPGRKDRTASFAPRLPGIALEVNRG